jgi:hypothetical protein
MKIEIILLIPILFWFYELCCVIKWLEIKKYIYNNIEHSVEHFVYLLWYLITMLLLLTYLYTKDNIILNYFIIMFTFSSISLIRHIQKERLNK